ncbi:MAG TPA: TatD family hydrolase [bacterium]|nr:TatD family hydrolase [bacterium]HPS28701.1 TatD family hydrolase [bacterium]
MITDCHIHLKQICELDPETVDYILRTEYSALVSCHSNEDLEFALKIKELKGSRSGRIYISYGVHPFSLDPEELEILKNLVSERKIDAIGEIGLDRYSAEQKKSFERQLEFFEIQLKIAESAGLPAVFHLRKSMQEFFTFSKEISYLKAVVFHSYSGTASEARSVLSRGINAFFSFGTPILNGHIKAIAAVSEIPLENILIETDAPYQPLKNKEWTSAVEIELILLKISEIKKVDLFVARQIILSNFVKMLTKV